MVAAVQEKDNRPDAASSVTGPVENNGDSSNKNAVVEAKPEVKAGNPVLTYFRVLVFGATPVDVALLIVGTIVAIAAGVPFPLMAILFGQLVNDLNGATCEAEANGQALGYESAINSKVLTLVYIGIGYFALSFIHMVSWNFFSQRLAQRLRERYFQSLLRQEQAFFDKRHAGDVSSRLQGDIQAVQSGTCEKVGIFIGSLSFFVTAYVVAFIKEPKLAGMLLSLIPAFLLVAIVGGGFTQKYAIKVADHIATASSIASEALSHITVVEAFGAGPRLEKKFAGHMLSARSDGIKKAMAIGMQAGLLYFVAYSANALAYWQGSRMIANLISGRGDSTSIGSIYTVVFIIVDACIVLGSAAPLLPLFGGASAAFGRLKSDMDQRSILDGTSERGQHLVQDAPGSIELRNVTFAYPSRPNDPVLKGVTLSFPAGKFTAIVGPSGSGKSTVAGLIARLHDPLEGTVLFDNQPLTEVNLRSLRSFISLVQQEPSLLDRSILENIALGLVNSPLNTDEAVRNVLLGTQLEEIAAQIRTHKTMPKVHDPVLADIIDRVISAAELADAADFIGRLEDGYGTMVGTLGKSVSGGQRQRISLARALIRNPKILILDEATASLDSASERRIQAAFDRVTKNRTVVSIAHRLSTIKHADNIIVLKAGEVVEEGSYDDLVARNGVFAGMVSLQALHSHDRGESASRSSTEVDSIDLASEENLDGFVTPKPEIGDTQKEDEEAAAETKSLGLDENQSFAQVTRQLARYVRPNVSWLTLAMFSAAIVGGTYCASGLILGHTVGALNPCNSTLERILQLGRLFGGMLFMLAVVEFFANFGSWASFGIVAERLLYSVRVLSFRSLFEQSVEWHQSGDRDPSMLLSVITKDTAALGGLSGSIIGTIFSILVNFLVAIILSHIIAWKIAVVCLTMIPILLGTGIMQLRSLSRYEERHAKAFAKSISITVEAVNSMKTISTLSLEHEVMGAYSRTLKASKKDILGASVFTNVWLALSFATGFLVYAFAYWWGGRLIMQGEYSQQQFFIVLIAMLVSAQLWGQMFTLAPEVSRSKASASRILSLIQAGTASGPIDNDKNHQSLSEKDIEASADSSTKLSSSNTRGVSVTFNNVNFSYPNRSSILALQDTSFTIAPGQFIGLVGPSGAGKSTIMTLVQGTYKPTSGSITMDGIPVSSRNFRDDIAIVPQDNALFNGTIKFNVSLGTRPDHEASDAEIEEACKLANIHETIMSLPKGYDTEVGPNGSQLSGGQRQRLTIARALVRKPRLLLLDESTSALDADSEMALQKGLERVVRAEGITVIAITHRLHTVVRADCIFVVEGGRVVDKGRHEDLVARRETYRDNAEHQMLQS